MNKKIKDLTLIELQSICEKHEDSCKACPLYNKICCDLDVYYVVCDNEKNMNKEIETE